MKKILIISFMVASCFKTESLDINSSIYLGDEIRLDGFFYQHRIGNDNTQILGPFIFLYTNGVVYYDLDSFYYDENLTLEENLKDVSEKVVARSSKWKDNRQGWGRFLVDNNRLSFEVWGYAPRHNVSYYSCNILNDTVVIMDDVNGNSVSRRYEFYTLEDKPIYNNPYVD